MQVSAMIQSAQKNTGAGIKNKKKMSTRFTPLLKLIHSNSIAARSEYCYKLLNTRQALKRFQLLVTLLRYEYEKFSV